MNCILRLVARKVVMHNNISMQMSDYMKRIGWMSVCVTMSIADYIKSIS